MKREKIAVIGSGISGISLSFLLSKKYDVYLFEKNNYLGGHTRTKNIEYKNNVYNIDTGFIVFNNNTYPDLVKFFNHLNIKTKNSNMSFSVSIKNPEIEYGSNGLKSLFAQKKNLFSFNFWFLILEILKLYKNCKDISSFDKNIQGITLEDFLKKNNYSETFKNLHIYPIVSSIWSVEKNMAKQFPMESFINFFNNHKLFNIIKRPKWKFIKGGSNEYIKSIIKKNIFKYKTKSCVNKILRNNNNVKIIFDNNDNFIADKVIIATHADQALNILNNPSKEEYDILSTIKYSKNFAYLHSDESFMPKHKSVWSSWNFQGKKCNDNSFSLTYWMNLLQDLQVEKNFFISINPFDTPKNCHDYTTFEHPIYNLETLLVQKKIKNIQGKNNTWFCGSYCGYGFHEDGIQSAAQIANLLGIKLPWKRTSNFYNRL